MKNPFKRAPNPSSQPQVSQEPKAASFSDPNSGAVSAADMDQVAEKQTTDASIVDPTSELTLTTSQQSVGASKTENEVALIECKVLSPITYGVKRYDIGETVFIEPDHITEKLMNSVKPKPQTPAQ